MFGSLYLKECKKVLKSISFYVYVEFLVAFMMSQLGEVSVAKPIKGQENYGFTRSDDKQDIMNCTLQKLQWEYDNNQFETYPVGFLKTVILNESKLAKVKNIMDELKETNSDKICAKESIDYDTFVKKMKTIDALLGGGSSYSKESLSSNAYVPMTYEQAMEEFEGIVYHDKISNAYARIFCDYLGIIMAIMPVFIAVVRCLKDRRAKASNVIYSKSISTTKIILSRYLAIVTLAIIPVILLSISPLLECMYLGNEYGITINYLAFIRLIGIWLLPSILMTVAVGFFITELTNGPIAILIQAAWWFLSIFAKVGSNVGTSTFDLVPRFSRFGEHQMFQEMYPKLVQNRIIFTLFSCALIVLTIYVYDKKRKGELKTHGVLHLRRKLQSEA